MLRIDSAWRLDLALSLQTTLNIGCTVELFARHSATIVPHDAVVFAAPQAALSVTKGRLGACGHSVELVLDKRPLGCLTFSRRGPFEPEEILALEAMAADMTRPLDNALCHREVREAAIRDPLTGAANRRHLERTLEREVSLVRRHGGDLALLMVDIDRFKSVNDRFGHLTGDRCLAAIAKCITARVRDSDTLFRYGGEEFCVLLAHTGAGGAWRLAERVREAVGTLRIPDGTQTIRLTASLGVASLAPGEGAEDLLRKADAALYRSKRSGARHGLRTDHRARAGGRPVNDSAIAFAHEAGPPFPRHPARSGRAHRRSRNPRHRASDSSRDDLCPRRTLRDAPARGSAA